MSISAMRQALEALRNAEVVYMEQLNAMYALQQAIAEAEKQEGWVLREIYFEDGEPISHREPQWVGLTDHELQVLDFNDPDRGKLARAVEVKLKERNT